MPGQTSSAHSSLVAKACRLIERSTQEPDLNTLARDAGMSPSHFHRVFKQVTGLTPKAYATAHKTGRMKTNLKKEKRVTDAMVKTGFGSSSRFYDASSKTLGMTPSAYKKNGKGQVIRFGIGQCSLGAILVGATEKGICLLTLSDDPQELIEDLQNRFKNAELIGGHKQFEKWMAKVISFVDRPKQSFDLPLDIQGTAFQKRVWEALRKIPYGKTATYADIAKKIGKPISMRAVANACGSNNIAVIIPCHRVIRTDGTISGYRWGVQRKKELLKKEGVD